MVHRVALLVLVAAISGACGSDRTVTLRSQDGKTALTYSCAKFLAKAETTAEAMVLFEYATTIQGELLADGKNVTAFEFAKLAQGNMRELERFVVQYQCDRKA